MKILHGIYDVKHSSEKEGKWILERIKFFFCDNLIHINTYSKVPGKQWNESGENDYNKGSGSIEVEWDRISDAN